MTYQKVKNRDGSESVAIKKINDDGKSASIPADPDNFDWVAYQKWLADGNIPLAAE